MLALALPGDSWAHRLGAPVKLAALALAVTGLMLWAGPWALALAGLAVLGLYASLGRAALRAGGRALRPLAFLAGLILAWHLALGQAALGGLIVLRILVLVSLANFVTLTTPLGAMTAVVETLGRPLARFGLSPRLPALAVALMLRALPEVQARAARLHEAWRARSTRRPGVKILVPLVLGVLDDAEQVSEALRARGGITPGPTRKAPARPDDQNRGQGNNRAKHRL